MRKLLVVLICLLPLSGCLDGKDREAKRGPDPDAPRLDEAGTAEAVYANASVIIARNPADVMGLVNNPGTIANRYDMQYMGIVEIQNEWSQTVSAHEIRFVEDSPNGAPEHRSFFDVADHRSLGWLSIDSGLRVHYQAALQGPWMLSATTAAELLLTAQRFTEVSDVVSMGGYTLHLAPTDEIVFPGMENMCETYAVRIEDAPARPMQNWLCIDSDVQTRAARANWGKMDQTAIWVDQMRAPPASENRPLRAPEVAREGWLQGGSPSQSVYVPPMGKFGPFVEPGVQIVDALAKMPGHDVALANEPDPYLGLLIWARDGWVSPVMPEAIGIAWPYLRVEESRYTAPVWELEAGSEFGVFLATPPETEPEQHLPPWADLPEQLVPLHTLQGLHEGVAVLNPTELSFAVPGISPGAAPASLHYATVAIWILEDCQDSKTSVVYSAVNGQILASGPVLFIESADGEVYCTGQSYAIAPPAE